MANGLDSRLTAVFVELADTLVQDFDLTDLFERLVEQAVDLLSVNTAALLLDDQPGKLQLMASSTEATRMLELHQLQSEEGPCMDCFLTGRIVAVPDLSDQQERWPRFVPAALREGFRAVHAVPMRLRDDVIGVLGLFNVGPHQFDDDEQSVAQALADICTIAILQERTLHRSEILVEQLQGALNSRVIIEQAKGLLAASEVVDMDEAFNRLRQMARSRNRRLSDVARSLVESHAAPKSPGRRVGKQAP